MSEKFTPKPCDKCGQPVAQNQSVVRLHQLADMFYGGCGDKDRHLFPQPATPENPKGCPGSPSRANLLRSLGWTKWSLEGLQNEQRLIAGINFRLNF